MTSCARHSLLGHAGARSPACVCSVLSIPLLSHWLSLWSAVCASLATASSRSVARIQLRLSQHIVSRLCFHCSSLAFPALDYDSTRHTARSPFASKHTFSYPHGQARAPPRATTKRRMRIFYHRLLTILFNWLKENMERHRRVPWPPLRPPRYPLHTFSVRHLRAGHGWAERDSIRRYPLFFSLATSSVSNDVASTATGLMTQPFGRPFTTE